MHLKTIDERFAELSADFVPGLAAPLRDIVRLLFDTGLLMAVEFFAQVKESGEDMSAMEAAMRDFLAQVAQIRDRWSKAPQRSLMAMQKYLDSEDLIVVGVSNDGERVLPFVPMEGGSPWMPSLTKPQALRLGSLLVKASGAMDARPVEETAHHA